MRDVPAHVDVPEKPEALPLCGLLEDARDRLDVRMIRCDPEPDEPPRRREPLDHVHLDRNVCCEERSRGIEACGPRPDHGHAKRTRLTHVARIITGVEPTQAQVEAYRRDGFVVIEQLLSPAEVGRLREHFSRAFDHDWETGLRPDEVNYEPGVTPPDKTRQLCNVWKADRTLAATVLAARNGELGARLAGAPGHAPDPGQRDLEATVGQGAPLPPGRRLRRMARAAEHDDLLDGARRHERGRRHDLLRQGLTPLATCAGGRAVPRPGRLARARRGSASRRRGAGARADRGAGRWRRLPRRLDVPRLAAQRARRPRAPLDRQSHGLDRRPAGRTAPRRIRSTRSTAGPASASSTRRSSRSCGARTGTGRAWLDEWCAPLDARQG